MNNMSHEDIFCLTQISRNVFAARRGQRQSHEARIVSLACASGTQALGAADSCEHFLRRRERSVGCDEGRFTFPEELLSKAKSHFVRFV